MSRAARGDPGRSTCLVDLGDKASPTFSALIMQAELYRNPNTAVCVSSIDQAGGPDRGGRSMASMVVVTASPASAERMVREGSDDLLRFEGFAGGSSHGRIVRVPDGLPADAVGHEGFDAQQFEYVGVVWSRGHVVGMVQIAGPTGDLGHQLAQLARLQDRRMAGFA